MTTGFNNNIHLSTGGEDSFLPKLLHAINHARQIDMAVSFVRSTGLNLINQALLEALERKPPVGLRVITGDYLEITEPQALRQLMLLQELGAEVKIYESPDSTSFHMKAYIFVSDSGVGNKGGCAFVGSSNISRMALTNGLEWNLRVDSIENPSRFSEIQKKYDRLYSDKYAKPLTHEWIDNYQVRYTRSQLTQKPEPVDIPDSPPEPNSVQVEALDVLHDTRDAGYRRALVVLATGIGKTWLSAFDAKAVNAKRVLFVAHREEILDQAEQTFIRIFPDARVGRYTGKQRELNVDMLFASVQTLGRAKHLQQFAVDYFDYVIVDEFHHASARTYQQLLAHFNPRFLLGLTATPERTDQADILSLCDDNLAFRRDLFDGINEKLLCPFSYYGIGDEQVNYQEIPWRNSKFDPTVLTSQLATQARARHAFKKWSELRQSRTLAFCVSLSHADFMAEYFTRHGISAVSVHSESEVRRNEALQKLTDGEIAVIFSVDLFNEGVDIPAVDTVMLLRPTESKILFQQQLGRGLRLSPKTDKSHLVIIDFIGNHISFFKKPETLFQVLSNNSARREFIDHAESGILRLPDGCFVNYDVKAIDFMRELVSSRFDTQLEIYRGLRDSLDRRPTLSEFYYGGGAVATVRSEHGQWLALVQSEGDMDSSEEEVFKRYKEYFRELEVTQMTKSFKMILLEAFLELGGFSGKIQLETLAAKSYEIIRRKRQLIHEIPEQFQEVDVPDEQLAGAWQKYWHSNPVVAWIGSNQSQSQPFFVQEEGYFKFAYSVTTVHLLPFISITQELISYRLSKYQSRSIVQLEMKPLAPEGLDIQEIPYFSDLKIACGYFRSSDHASENIEYIGLPSTYGKLDPAKHFIARASGNSMNGGKNSIKDGDYLLLELIDSISAGSISNQAIAIERQDGAGDDQYLLRDVRKRADGGYDLLARNSSFPVFQANEEMRTFARLKFVINPLSLALHQSFMREKIPGLFGYEFKKGAWESGHVTIKGSIDQFLFVTLNKQGKQQEHQYHDYFKDKHHFHWQSQNSTDPKSGKGKRIINHEKDGSDVYLFVRKNKLEGKTAAPFVYCGTLIYQSHSGAKPMDVEWRLDDPLTDELLEYFK